MLIVSFAVRSMGIRKGLRHEKRKYEYDTNQVQKAVTQNAGIIACADSVRKFTSALGFRGSYDRSKLS